MIQSAVSSLLLLSSPPLPDSVWASQSRQVLSASLPHLIPPTIISHLIYSKTAPWNQTWLHLLPPAMNPSQGLCHTGSACQLLPSSSLNPDTTPPQRLAFASKLSFPRWIQPVTACQNDTAESRASYVNTFRPSPSSLPLLSGIWQDWTTLGSTAKEHRAYSTWLAWLAPTKRMCEAGWWWEGC